ncbi:dihydrofolate reductase-like domain-containing protein [Amylocarpus encephaloides]|uniref:Dihydrofolate reductase n=1 Tax=Amylocarpus encephaloides TaxID=45428 RepID=A0A9P8C200_9HELO|nr:dihydrofolate reductase-like domain-containing protein [Amylocarpus encephaloides]
MVATMSELTLIVAATSKMGIGLNGGLPWAGLRKEMAYFARVTKRVVGGSEGRNIVIMGRKTWDSIPPKFRPLKDRHNIIISRILPPVSDDGTTTIVPSLAEALKVVARGSRRAFVIGGAQIYGAALERPETKRILLTRILDEFECDAHFPIELGGNRVAEVGWKRKDMKDLGTWTGEGEAAEGVKEESGTKYEFEMWERD